MPLYRAIQFRVRVNPGLTRDSPCYYTYSYWMPGRIRRRWNATLSSYRRPYSICSYTWVFNSYHILSFFKFIRSCSIPPSTRYLSAAGTRRSSCAYAVFGVPLNIIQFIPYHSMLSFNSIHFHLLLHLQLLDASLDALSLRRWNATLSCVSLGELPSRG